MSGDREWNVSESKPADAPAFNANELAQMEEAYQQYALLAAAYERVIQLEDCPLRKEQLRSLLCQLHEDNK